MKILLLEDHPFQCRLLVKMLNNLGYMNVTEATLGQQALEYMRNHTFDIMICDLHLPDMDGMAVLRQAATEGFRGGIILSSAVKPAVINTVTHMTKAQGLNLLGSMPKPITDTELKQLLESYHAPSKQITPPPFSPTLSDIANGLAQGEFINYYQPKVCLTTGEMQGVEALVRWQHPLHGILSPACFIDLIEESNLVDDLLLSVTTMAIKDYRQWTKTGWQGSVSINVSAANLISDEISNTLLQLTQAAQIPPDKIIFELTERIAIKRMEKVLEAMARLSMQGFGLSIDDFGTGFSSLHHLEVFPFTELKLDRSFVNTCLSSQTSKAIIDFSISLARRLELKLVFEGIEDAATWDYLKQFNYGACQGYFSAKPMPTNQLMGWYKAWVIRFPSI